MTLGARAIHAIQHAVQEHGDEHTIFKSVGMDLEAMIWFGRLLGWTWPPSYLEILGKYDGVNVQLAIVHGFVDSIHVFLTYREKWELLGYWPVGDDGCGNYHVLAIKESDQNGECPVLTIYHDEEEPVKYSKSYAEFIFRLMREQCEDFGCSHSS